MAGQKILVVSMGQGGNAVASAFFDRLLAECGVGPNGEPPSDPALADALTVFCDRTPSGNFVPRRLMAAASRDALPAVQGANRAAYPEDAYVVETEEVKKNNWACGHNAPSISALFRAVQRLASLHSDCAVWLFHALGGSYGAGGGSRLLELLSSEYGGTLPIISVPILPSPMVSDSTVAESYNAVLALEYIVDNASQALVIDNGGVFTAAGGRERAVQHADLNALIAGALTTLVAPILWPASDGTRLSVRELHSALWTQAYGRNRPWMDDESMPPLRSELFVSLSLGHEAALGAEAGADLAARLRDSHGAMLSGEKTGRWVRMFVIYAGREDGAAGIGGTLQGVGARLALNAGARQNLAIAAGMNKVLINSFTDLSERFTHPFKRQFLLHEYYREGMEKDDFSKASSALLDLIAEMATESTTTGPWTGES